MTQVTRVSRPFRIVALPLVRIPHGPLRVGAGKAAAGASASGNSASTSTASTTSTAVTTNGAATPSSSEAPLTLYHVQQPDPSPQQGPPPIYQRALDKAADAWLKLGDKPKNSWMYWFFEKGEGLMDRIEFEEWELKNVHKDQGVKLAKKGEVQEKITIPLLRPSTKSIPPLLPKLHRSLLHKIPYHRRRMWQFLLFSPVTWPFAIIPIIPNFPMFYFLWRAWSHYKAWQGAEYLQGLLKAGMIVERPSEQLDAIYDAAAKGSTTLPSARLDDASKAADIEAVQAADPAKAAEPVRSGSADRSSTSSSDKSEFSTPKPKPGYPRYPGLLLTTGQLPALERAFGLRQSEVIDVTRAIEQADHRAADAAKALKEKSAA